MKIIASFYDLCRFLAPIAYAIKDAGGTPYLVGGCVRDVVLGCELKDADVEVHGLTVDHLEKVLKKFGHVRVIGKKFGVLRIDSLDVDWSLPRRDSKGRKPVVEIDPHMTIQMACRRRDLTMNAMAIDLYQTCRKIEAGESFKSISELKIIDPYGGLNDIAAKQLNAIDEKLFLEDPLRFFRVMQFIGRFQMLPSDELNKLCAAMKLWDEQTNAPISRERIFDELKKLFLKSSRPSLGIRWLRDIGRLKEVFPEVHALIGVPQRPDYHPEGDVFEHTMQSLDAAAQQSGYQATDRLSTDDEKFLILLTMFVHDLGKVSTTDAALHCKGHEMAGVPLAEQLLKRITDDRFLIAAVKKLVKYHCAPVQLTQEGVGQKAFKRLALKLAPEVTLRHISLVGRADVLGRNAIGHEPLRMPELPEHIKRIELFLQRAQEARVDQGPEKPVLLGRHLLDVIPPGDALGLLLERAYHIQIDEGIKDWQELRRRVLEENEGRS